MEVDFSEKTVHDKKSGETRPLSSYTYSEIFELKFPYYLSIGMTYKQYWEDDCNLVKFYREADKLRRERTNWEMWLQGMYIYDAIGRLSSILRFSQKPQPPMPYIEKPYNLNQDEEDIEKEKIDKEKQKFENDLKFMQAFMIDTNKKFADKEREENARHNN